MGMVRYVEENSRDHFINIFFSLSLANNYNFGRLAKAVVQPSKVLVL